ncbi:hypothetical protein [Caulobacter sp. 17J80-11]|uniref:hypothetical protein n=1 Tax=Caulobacter sp. 17J80-11 TaxID=2763502 RepID=UPI0016537975|nr:hypothetical protein [Caulobacter sp. 17J80-11]MBC6981599.1 hypothetical protein [Caulobacter sp. 17J80-11]
MLDALLLAATVAASPACSAPEHRQLDFWIGRWTVIDARTGAIAGESVVEPAWEGCAVREEFHSPDGFVGGSLNAWDKAAGQWRQFGAGSTGAARAFAGSWTGEAMELHTSQPRPGQSDLLIVMRLQPLSDGGLRQWSDVSRDGGATWSPRYDYFYRPRP